MQEAAPGRPILHLGSPAPLMRAWKAWAAADPGVTRWTVTASRALSRYLMSRLPSSVDHRVLRLWDLAWRLRPEGMAFVPYEAVPSLLASDVRSKVLPRWRGPGVAEALLEAATVIRRNEESLDALEAIPPSWREPLGVAFGRLDQVVRRGFDEVRLYRYAAGGSLAPLRGARLAIYGLIEPRPAQNAFLEALARKFPLTVFVPWTFGSADAYAVPWVEWWEAHGALMEEHPQESPRLVGVAAASLGFEPLRQIIEGESASHPNPRDWALGAPLVAEARSAARWLKQEGVPVALDPSPSHADDRLGAAMRAAVPDAGADDVLTWLRQSQHSLRESEREVLVRHGRSPSAWPPSILRRKADLERTFRAVLEVRRFPDVLPAMERFLDAAGVSVEWGEEEAERLSGFDRAGITPDADSVKAWLEGARRVSPGPGLGMLVTTLWELRGTHHRHLIVTGLDAEAYDPAPEWDTGVGAGWILAAHPARRARRELGIRHLEALSVVSADVVYVLGSPERPWPSSIRPSEILRVEPRRHGPGLQVSRSRRALAFGPHDGRFDKGQVDRPRSPSGYETFGRCPLQYAFQALGVTPWAFDRPDPEPSQVGIWAHRVLEKVLQAKRNRPELADLYPEVRRAVEDAVRENPPPDSVLGPLVDLQVESLAADLTWYLLGDWPKGLVNTEFKWSADGLSGMIDRVEFLGDELLVVDYKTGTVPKASPSPLALQLPLYAEAAQREYQVPYDQIRARYQGVRASNEFRSAELPGNVTAQVAAAREIVSAIDRLIDSGQLFLNPHEGACRSCEFRPACSWEAPRNAARKLPSAPPFQALWDQGARPQDGPS